MSSPGCKKQKCNLEQLLAASVLPLKPGTVAAVWQLKPSWKSGSRPARHSLQMLAPCMRRPSNADNCATQA